jgi:hypothetical protein
MITLFCLFSAAVEKFAAPKKTRPTFSIGGGDTKCPCVENSDMESKLQVPTSHSVDGRRNWCSLDKDVSLLKSVLFVRVKFCSGVNPELTSPVIRW